MGLIDKKKLLKSVKEEYPFISEEFYKTLENFPEEPEIDFDALWDDYEQKYSCKKSTSCDNCTYPNKLYYTTSCFVDFLKSKHLTAQKKRQIPVKKVWTLKKEYEDFVFACGIPNVTIKFCCGEPEHKEFYDLTETPDYSQVPVGAVVEVYHNLSNKPNYGIVQKNSNNMLSITCNINSIDAFCIHYSHIKSLTILKAAE